MERQEESRRGCLTVEERPSGEGTDLRKEKDGPKRYEAKRKRGGRREVRIGKAEEDGRSGKAEETKERK